MSKERFMLYQNSEFAVQSDGFIDNPYNKPLTAIVHELAKLLNHTKSEVKTKTEYIQEQRDVIDEYKSKVETLENFHINLVGVKDCDIKELVEQARMLKEIQELVSTNKNLYEEIQKHGYCTTPSSVLLFCDRILQICNPSTVTKDV